MPSDDRNYGLLDYPDRAISGGYKLLRDNFRLLILIAAFSYLAVLANLIDAPNVGLGIPLWARVLLVFGAVAAVGGHWLGSKIFDQPEPDWQYLHVYNEADPTTPYVEKVTPAVMQDMDVYGGRRLSSPDGSPNHYYCRYYNGDPDNPVAHVTHKDVPSDSELLGTKPSVIEEKIVAMRETYEDTHGQYRWVLDHLYMVVRRLDFRRTESQNAVLDDHVTPSVNDESVSDVVDDIMPDRLKPERLQGGEPDEDHASSRDDDEESIEDTTEDIAPDSVSEPADAALPAATDGGKNE